jgi:hypothetical protein
MRAFHSYGPVDSAEHYSVDRKDLVDQCTNQLIGNIKKGGHYFTIWGARQTGKTWIVEQSVDKISRQYKDQFKVAYLSMQGFADEEQTNLSERFFDYWPGLIEDEFHLKTGKINSWKQWLNLFNKQRGIFDTPVILLIDEFDKLHTQLINQLISLFREMYLKRNNYCLHGLALIGVRSVLGVDNKSGSPFNIQRSLHIENLSFDEVKSMFDQYQKESTQLIEPDVIEKLYEKTQGQPGLTGWFGELLTEKYNPNRQNTIDIEMWNFVYLNACEIEHNNTIQNMISKARNDYKSNIINLFTDSDIYFSFRYDWCNYMYMHGLIGYNLFKEGNQAYYICRFSSPFIQTCLYRAFIGEIKENQDRSMIALDPLDTLDDVFDGPDLNIPALLSRYKNYLKRMKESGEDLWKDQPRRKSDFHLTEAVGHFHLYHWLSMALRKRCIIRPEFPTGNGKVDLHLLSKDDKKGLIEVKSFVNAYEVKESITQAAKYASKTNHSSVSIALFAPFTDENVLTQLSRTETIDDITVTVVAIGQG